MSRPGAFNRAEVSASSGQVLKYRRIPIHLQQSGETDDVFIIDDENA
jgi:hypothetical protein